jgi:hypothetical protein
MNIEDEDSEEKWMEEQGIDVEMLRFLADKIGKSFLFQVMVNDADPKDAIHGVVCAMFQLGWEAHREYGGRLSERP